MEATPVVEGREKVLVVKAWKESPRPQKALMAVILFYIATTALVHLDAWLRHDIPMKPWAVAFAASIPEEAIRVNVGKGYPRGRAEAIAKNVARPARASNLPLRLSLHRGDDSVAGRIGLPPKGLPRRAPRPSILPSRGVFPCRNPYGRSRFGAFPLQSGRGRKCRVGSLEGAASGRPSRRPSRRPFRRAFATVAVSS